MRKIKFIPLLSSLAICFLAGGIGSIFTFSEIPTWYASLHKPFFNPPNQIFGPVWSLLYFLMGISLYIFWTRKGKKNEKKQPARYFFLQLSLNALWSIVFFGLHSPLSAFFIIVALWISIFLTIKSFFHISKIASYLLIPYICWVSFASLLNLFIFLLN